MISKKAPKHFRDVVECIFRSFDRENICYLVLRNYETLPESTENDIDLLVSRKQKKDVISLLGETAKENHWKISKIVEFSCTSVFMFCEETLEQIHLDLMFDLRWHSLVFANADAVLENRLPFKMFYKPSPCHEAMINLLTRLVYGGYVKERYRQFIRDTAKKENESFAQALSFCMGRKLASKVSDFAADGRWEDIETLTRKIRKNIILLNCRRPFRLIRQIGSDVIRILYRSVHFPGRAALILHDPDEDTNSIINILRSGISGTYQSGRITVTKITDVREISLQKCWSTLFRNGVCFFSMEKNSMIKSVPWWCLVIGNVSCTESRNAIYQLIDFKKKK